MRQDLRPAGKTTSLRAHHREQLARQREEKERFERELTQFRADKAQRSAALAAQNWKGKGELVNAMRSVAAAEAKKVELEIRERHRRETKRCVMPAKHGPYRVSLPSGSAPGEAGDYRYHRHEPLRLKVMETTSLAAYSLRAFTGEVIGGAVGTAAGAAGVSSEAVSFTDHGRHASTCRRTTTLPPWLRCSLVPPVGEITVIRSNE